ncbi:MAG: dihydroneopterin aldolase [Prosthecobacter sp.]|jgi:dihydroneopterin aldolase|nr:dihydroneopterin aldolase [Prosthecobacter sp.]
MQADSIHLRGLDLPTRIGVPEEERAAWQTLQANICLELEQRFEAMADDLSATIDYAAVALRLRSLAAEKPRRLIETLAAEIASCLLLEFGAALVRVELRKKILPGCDHVAVVLTRLAEKKVA